MKIQFFTALSGISALLGGIIYLSSCGTDSGSGSSVQKEVSALTLIGYDDCLNCHNIEDKSVGPSYLRVARRYEADSVTVNRLAGKIIEGGGGLWGGGQMTKHPFLKKEDAKKIVHWILSLDDPTLNEDPMKKEGTILNAMAQATSSIENGLKIEVYAYENNSGGEFSEIPQGAKPLFSGIAGNIHFPSQQSFAGLRHPYRVKATGFITIDKPGKYFFKLVRKGKGRVILDETVIINENEWDTESDKDLTAGTYPITIEYMSAPGSNALSLQWISPDTEYYHLIPKDAFKP